MNIHEYQAKNLLKSFGVTVPNGYAARTADEALENAHKLGGNQWVVKAQIHAGGRGKAGGVKLVDTLDDLRKTAENMLGKILVTAQTGPEGKEVKRLLIEQGCSIQKEFYLSMLIDRQHNTFTLIASPEGGVNIEEVAEKTPEKILRLPIDPLVGLSAFHTREVAFFLGLSGKQIAQANQFLNALYKSFTTTDASLVEINPMILTQDDTLMALDAKVSFDDNALYRQKDIAALRDKDEEDQAELEASKHELNYVKLDGNIGCMVNGAGLAMATMDIIKLHGGEPANFLDVGGNATAERIAVAFQLVLADPNVKGILVNIFGGIMRCNLIAEGILKALETIPLSIPLVIRLEGTNVTQGQELLQNAPFPIITATTLTEAAQKIVQAVKETE